MGTKSEIHSVMRLVASGRFKPILDRVFPLAEAAAAHAHLESGSQFGKSSFAFELSNVSRCAQTNCCRLSTLAFQVQSRRLL